MTTKNKNVRNKIMEKQSEKFDKYPRQTFVLEIGENLTEVLKTFFKSFIQQDKTSAKILRTLTEINTEIKELKKITMTNQETVDRFITDINARFDAVDAKLVSEGEQIRAAIGNSAVNTTAFQTVLERATALSTKVEELYEEAEEPPVEEEETPE